MGSSETLDNIDALHRALADAYHAANKANIAKSRFLASMSHDIRTPLNAIIGMAAIGDANRNDPEKVHHCFSEITASSKYLLGLLNEILEMNKVETGNLGLNEAPFRMSEFLEVFLALSRPLAAEKKHALIVDIHDITHEALVGDSERIRQCLMNFMTNAVKYTQEGGTIRFEASEKPTNRPNVVCCEFIFEDNGIGMEPEFVKELFEPFSRAEDERVMMQPGTGLGLSITRAMVQMMNGDILVESKPNEGSRFTVTVFLRTQEGKQWAEQDRSGNADVPVLDGYRDKHLEGKRVLLVEDNDLNAEIAAEILEMTGLAVDLAKNGREAVEILTDSEDGRYDLVFMDIQMPVMDGYESTRMIRGKDREYLKNIPIVAMSANAFTEDIRMAKEAGMNGHLAKPLDFERLLDVLNHWLSLRGRSNETKQCFERRRL